MILTESEAEFSSQYMVYSVNYEGNHHEKHIKDEEGKKKITLNNQIQEM